MTQVRRSQLAEGSCVCGSLVSVQSLATPVWSQPPTQCLCPRSKRLADFELCARTVHGARSAGNLTVRAARRRLKPLTSTNSGISLKRSDMAIGACGEGVYVCNVCGPRGQGHGARVNGQQLSAHVAQARVVKRQQGGHVRVLHCLSYSKTHPNSLSHDSHDGSGPPVPRKATLLLG